MKEAMGQLSTGSIVAIVAQHLAERNPIHIARAGNGRRTERDNVPPSPRITTAMMLSSTIAESPLLLFQEAYAAEMKKLAELEILSSSDVAAAQVLREETEQEFPSKNRQRGQQEQTGPTAGGSARALTNAELEAELRTQVTQLSMDYSKLGQESSRKDVQLAKQQKRIDELIGHVMTLQHCLSLGIAPPPDLVTDANLEKTLEEQSAKQQRKEVEEMTMHELIVQNRALADYIETLEGNMTFGFQYDTAELNASIKDLVMQNESIQARCQQFACVYLEKHLELQQKEKETKNLDSELRHWMRKHELLEREFNFLKTEMERMKERSFLA